MGKNRVELIQPTRLSAKSTKLEVTETDTAPAFVVFTIQRINTELIIII